MANPRPTDTPVTGAEDDFDMEAAEAGEEAGLTELEPEAPKLVLFSDLVRSPIVEVKVGAADQQVTFPVHEAVLIKSPELQRLVSEIAPGGHRQVTFSETHADADAMGSVIEYLYTGEYFPKRSSQSRDAPLERDPRLPHPDDEGLGLLTHARVYTLADRLGLPDLKSLAHSKIHRTASTAKGELAYARFVYKESNPEDTTIRKPVAAFWATRSFSLRHEAEPEFRAMCLEFPQFSYDVLQLVLDQQEKSRRATSSGGAGSSGGGGGGGDDASSHKGPAVMPGSTRKRQRHI